MSYDKRALGHRLSHGRLAVAIAVCVRVTVALLSTTFFQPDEYYQALEPAHHLVFGYGHLTWEWRVRPPIRSILYPMLFVPGYWMLKVLGWDQSVLLLWAPKVVQGLLASITDIAVCRLARNVLGERYASTAFFLSLSSLFHVQTLSRTLTNSLETSLTALALSYWPFASSNTKSSLRLVKPILAAAVSSMIRPTSAIIWFFLIMELSWRLRHDVARLLALWIHVCAVGIAACACLFILDSWYFGTYTFTPLNFLITNLSSVSSFYGRSPWHYYLTQAIPIICNVSAPSVVYGVWKGLRAGSPSLRRLIFLVCWTIGVYSLAAHKEWRFIHPLLPAMHVIASKPIVDGSGKHPDRATRSALSPWRIIVWLVLIPYLLFVQSRGQITVLHHLRSVPVEELQSVGFLMPCHSTPWQGYLHRPHLKERMLWALGCEPPIGGEDLETYQDQSDIFYASPIDYLRAMFPAAVDPDFPASPFPTPIPGAGTGKEGGAGKGQIWRHTWPSHLVIFGSLLDHNGVRALLEELGYREEWHGWNGWQHDWRRRGGVRVWRWQRKLGDAR